MKKRILSLLLAAVLLFCPLSLVGCGRTPEEDGSLDIVVTVFPIYDWVKNLLGEKAEEASITLLLDNGVDLHSYQPTFSDIEKIASCDLFVYIGGESDAWVDDVLKVAGAEGRRVLNLTEALGDAVLTEKHDHDHEEDDHEEDTDEHIWLSLRRASVLCGAISEELCVLDPTNASLFAANCEAYRAKLAALDARYAETVAAGKKDTLLFADRFPFLYLTEDYGLAHYAAFSGCSTETNATPEMIIFLAERIDALGLTCVIKLEGTTHKTPETVIASTETKDQKILVMNSLQSIGAQEIAAGVTYLSVMEDNLAVLVEALQ